VRVRISVVELNTANIAKVDTTSTWHSVASSFLLNPILAAGADTKVTCFLHLPHHLISFKIGSIPTLRSEALCTGRALLIQSESVDSLSIEEAENLSFAQFVGASVLKTIDLTLCGSDGGFDLTTNTGSAKRVIASLDDKEIIPGLLRQTDGASKGRCNIAGSYCTRGREGSQDRLSKMTRRKRNPS